MESTWLWAGFGVVVAGILAFDLGVVGRQRRDLGLRQALLMVGVYVALAVAFGVVLFVVRGTDAGMEYFTAYLLEQSLSLDNIFIWVLIFEYFRIPEEAEHKVLFWGILGAMVLRAAFVFAGTALIEAFEWMLYLFGALVLFSAVRLFRSRHGEERDMGNRPLLRFLRRRLNVTPDYQGRRFFLREDGRLRATPLLLALIVIELTDFVFALDSIPAIFGVTRDPLVIYSSNIFAVLGLRALYFAVEGLVERLHFLRRGLALLLVLIGTKMIMDGFVAIPLWATLAATVGVLGGTIGMSLLYSAQGADRRA